MIENWLTWSLPGKSGRPSIISAKMQPADQMSTVGKRSAPESVSLSPIAASATPGRLTGNVVLLPREHDFRSAVVPRRNVTSHLRVRQPRQAKVTDLEVAVLVHENVGRLQIPVHDAGRVHVLETALSGIEGSRLVSDGSRGDISPGLCRATARLTRIWYRKYWMNCFSRGRLVKRRWRSVPRSSVTK